MSFREITLQRLVEYKRTVLNIQEDGIFPYRGKRMSEAHVLPESNKNLNILEPYRQRFFSSEYQSIKLHRFFHHLNSSQALCVNLFLPLKEKGRLGVFLDCLGIPSEGQPFSQFEKGSEVEIASRPTSFDFYLKSADHEVFVEVKYTEDGFGRAKNDSEHQEKFHRTYLPLLKNSRYLSPACQDETVFLQHYQVLRNLVHIGREAYVVLLFPAGNKRVEREAFFARDHFLTNAGRDRLRVVLLENLLAHLGAKVADPALRGYYRMFQEKYQS